MRLGYSETIDYLEGFELFLAGSLARQEWGAHVCMAAKFEATPNGSPEQLVDDGVEAAAKVTAGWAAQLVRALEPATTETAILSVLERFETGGFRVDDFANIAADKFMRATMLGALDSQWEREHEQALAPIKFAIGGVPKNITGSTYAEALKHWDSQQVLTRPAFDALEEGTKRRAFTVARMAKSELLDATHAELRRQIALGSATEAAGVNLRDFHKFADARLKSAGWTPASPSHVETIFRTNVISALSSGRFTEMRQPSVLAALPYWQIFVVKDPRTRPTHRAADGVVLLASDPFWAHAYPPFGYNCRCKVCARTKAWLDRNSKAVGSAPKDLPDPGFDSGTKNLIPVPDAALKQAPGAAPAEVPKKPPPGLGPPSPLPDHAPGYQAPASAPGGKVAPAPAGLGAPSPFVPYEPPALPRPVKFPTEAETVPAHVARPPASLSPPSPFPDKAPPPKLNPIAHKLAEATGSNPGGVYEGSDGVKRYVKFYKDPAQAVGEHLANSLYSDLGFGGVKSSTFEHGGGLAYASEILPDTRTINQALAGLSKADAKKLAKKALDGFAADVLTMNWDAAGLNLDNMLVDGAGNITRIDNGAAFLTRAQGARKPAHLLDNVTEWDTFFDASRNPGYARLAKNAGVKSAEDLQASIKKSVEKISKIADAPGGWARYVSKRADGALLADQQAMVDMLEARTDFLKKKVAEFKPVERKARKAKEAIAPHVGDFSPVTREEIQDTAGRYHDIIGKTTGYLKRHKDLGPLRNYTGSGYSDLNDHLLGRSGPIDQARKDYVEAQIARVQQVLVDARAKGHALKGAVYRGIAVTDDELAAFVPGGDATFLNFGSTSIKESVSWGFTSPRGNKTNRVMFRIRQRSAIPVDKISVNKSEVEAVLPHGTKFRVIAREKATKNTYGSETSFTWIDLEEL